MDRICSSPMCVEMEVISYGAVEGWRGAFALDCGAGAGGMLDRLR